MEGPHFPNKKENIFLILCESSDRFWLCQLHDLSNFRLSCRWVAVISRTFMVPGCSFRPKTTFRKRPLLVDDISFGGSGGSAFVYFCCVFGSYILIYYVNLYNTIQLSNILVMINQYENPAINKPVSRKPTGTQPWNSDVDKIDWTWRVFQLTSLQRTQQCYISHYTWNISWNFNRCWLPGV